MIITDNQNQPLRIQSKLVLWCCLSLFVCFASFSQAKPLLQFHNLDKSHGLASSVVYDIAEDNDGFVWFATQDGLQRYDGVEFTSFRFNPVNENSISNNIVRKILFTNDGLLWIGTEDGITIFDPYKFTFKKLETLFPQSEKLSSKQIREIYQTRDEKVWVGTGAGLSSIDLGTKSIVNYELEKVRSVFEDDFQRLWIGTLGEGLFLFDRALETFTSFNRYRHASGDIEKLKNTKIIDIFQDSFGRILIGTWGDGVLRLNPESKILTSYNLDLPSLFVRSIHQDEIGQLWFGTNKGIFVQDTIEQKNQNIYVDHSNIFSPNSDNVTAIFQGKDNTLWFGTFGGGVVKHNPESRQFETYGPNKESKFERKDAVISAIYESDFGEVWIGTESSKLFRFSQETRTLESYPILYPKNSFNEPILVIYQDTRELFLVGTPTGIYQFKMKNKTFEFVGEFQNGYNDTIAFISKIKNEKIVVGYANRGVFIYSKNSEGVFEKTDFNLREINKPQSFTYINDGQFFIGTQGEGVYSVHLNDEVNIEFLHHTKNLNILSMTLDWKENLWIATVSKGILKFSKNDDTKSFNEFSGLPNNTVYSIISDRNSNKIWASTNKGLVSIDIQSENISSFSFFDGLQGNEFNRPGIKSKQGYIYFGGLNGFNRFYPKVINSSIKLNPIKITDFEVNESANGFESIHEKNWLSSEVLEIDYNQIPFSFTFTSPQFTKSDWLQYRYRLKGLNDKWITTDKLRKANFAHVPSGEYEFEVQVRNRNEGWSNNTVSQRVLVIPPLWLSLTAKIFYCVLLLVLVLSLIHRYRIRKNKDLVAQKALADSEKRLRLSLWGGGYEIWDWDLQSGNVKRSRENNASFESARRLSSDLSELNEYIHEFDRQKVKDSLRLHLRGITPYFEERYRLGSEKKGYRWVQDRGKVVERNEFNEPIRMSGTQADISELHNKDEEIERLGQAFNSTSDGVWIRNKNFELIDCNPAFEKITGFSKVEKEKEVLWFPKNDNQSSRIITIIKDSLKVKGTWQGEVWAERKNAEAFPQKLSIDTILDENGVIINYVGVFTDITYRKKTEAELRRLANFDTLTGLPNRACLFDRLSQTLDKARIRNEKFAVFKIDIDNFKRFNDSFGQNTGNDLIVQVARRLTNCISGVDTLARVGGDEFVVIQDDIESFSDVATNADRMLKELNSPILIHGQELTLNFSIGITISPDDGLSADKLLRNADTAMYEAKKEVLNSSHFYSTDLNKKAKNKLSMENALRKAIENHDIELYYQPKVDLRDGRVCGMEALARWNLAGHGNVPPDSFIKLAEDTRLILPLGDYLFKKAVKQTKEWVDSGTMRGRMCFNLSAHQFWNRDLCAEVKTVLDSFELDAKYIEFEITESACMQDVEQTISQMKKLRELGAHMALDDFGTGYSSLAQLKALPLDTLKVDKSFIADIENNNKDANLVKAIIDIANNLDLGVVIEGVETQSQCECLWQNRANIIQGFYFSQPVTLGIMNKLLSKTWNRADYLNNLDLNVTSLK
ncbi:MAG: EAL domain-containing protein [Kangiellaceae bacterium]